VVYLTLLYRRIILKWTLKDSVGKTWTGLIWFPIGTTGDFFERGYLVC